MFLNFWGFNLDVWRLEVVWDQKYFHDSKAHIHDFLSNFYWHFLSISYRFWDIWLPSLQGLTLTFKSHLGSKIFSAFECLYMTSYLTSIDTFSLAHTDFEIFVFNVFRVWPWPLEKPEVKNIFSIREPKYDLLSNFHWHFLFISYRLLR